MFILDNVPLSAYSTMKLGGNAAHLTDITDKNEVPTAVAWAEEHRLPVIMIGGGSNIIWRDEGFEGLVLVNKIEQFDVQKFDEETAFITIGGGEIWDSAVERIVELGYSGVELLSLIPGTAGGAPVQNIGAYGSQLSDTLMTIEAYDIHERKFVILKSEDCEFGYRTSRFKTTDRNRFLITSITLRVLKTPAAASTYHSLEQYLQSNNITDRNAKTLRVAVIAVRSSKLPDPTVVANCGSFFQNPIITKEHLEQILGQYPRLSSWHSTFLWDLPDGRVKVAAGALLEHEGFKDFHDPQTGMATWKDQSLVLVNEHAEHAADLLAFKQKITDTVKQKFDIDLVQEPEILP